MKHTLSMTCLRVSLQFRPTGATYHERSTIDFFGNVNGPPPAIRVHFYHINVNGMIFWPAPSIPANLLTIYICFWYVYYLINYFLPLWHEAPKDFFSLRNPNFNSPFFGSHTYLNSGWKLSDLLVIESDHNYYMKTSTILIFVNKTINQSTLCAANLILPH